MKELADTFKIENKPVASSDYGVGRRARYPFFGMKVGQSFFVPDRFDKISSLRSSAVTYGKRHNMKFAIIREGDGFRCGRVE